MRLVLLLLCLCLPVCAQADEVFAPPALGVNAVFYEDNTSPSDVELGLALKASLQPRISVVGQAFYGFDGSYLRGWVGPRFCLSDPNDRVFSAHLGVGYQASSEPELRAEEWCYETALGVSPWVEHPRVILTARGSYGLTSSEAAVEVGARFILGGAK